MLGVGRASGGEVSSLGHGLEGFLFTRRVFLPSQPRIQGVVGSSSIFQWKKDELQGVKNFNKTWHDKKMQNGDVLLKQQKINNQPMGDPKFCAATMVNLMGLEVDWSK